MHVATNFTDHIKYVEMIILLIYIIRSKTLTNIQILKNKATDHK